MNYGIRGRQKFRPLVCRAKDKNKIKTFEEKMITAFDVNKKWKNKIYRIPALQLTRSKSKKQKESDI